jgi:hypothetical protein
MDYRKNEMDKKRDLITHNKKILLCRNIIGDEKKCKYMDKCAFAHSLKEQKLLPIRKQAYDIINGDQDLSHIDLSKNRELYNTLEQLTKVCNACEYGKCTGGYNCRNGAIDCLHQVCFEDLTYGNCKRENCMAVHLTKRGLKPFIKIQQTNLIAKKVVVANEFLLEVSDDDSDIETSIFDNF